MLGSINLEDWERDAKITLRWMLAERGCEGRRRMEFVHDCV
jgi:hypothetical protein